MSLSNSKFEIRNSKSRSGAALLLALWALFLLSAMVIAWALSINSRLTVSSNANRVLEAEAMASSGADVALAREVSPSSPNLHRQMGDAESYDVQMVGECGRLNLNLLAPGGAENRVLKEVLKSYLTLKGVELNDVDVMMDSLLDWMSPTRGLHRLNAPEESDDYHPPHAPLTSADELKKVFGWSEFTSKAGWDEDFTVCIQCNQGIDLAWASRDLLRALGALGIGDDQVDRFLQLRRGPDGVDGTADDTPFNDLNDAIIRGLGLSPQQAQQFRGQQGQSLLTFKSPVFRVVSTGRSRDVTRSVQMIVQKQTVAGGAAAGITAVIAVGRPTILSWKEL